MASPGGREVGRLSIRVLPDTSDFEGDLHDYLRRIEQRAKVQVAIEPNFGNFRSELSTYLQGISESIKVGLDLDRDNFRQEVRNEVSGASQSVRVPVRFRVTRAEIQRLRRLMASLTPPITIPARLDVDDRALRDLTANLGRVGSSAQTAANGVSGLLPLLGRLGAAATSIPTLAGLTASLAKIGPLAAVAAPAVLSLGAAGAALAVGFRGVGDALRGDEEALRRITPQARDFVEEIRTLGPEWSRLQRNVQSNLFDGLGESFSRAAKDVLPVLREQLGETSSALNLMGKTTARTAGSLSSSGELGQALAGANKGLRNLSTLPGVFLAALTRLSIAAAPAFDKITQAAARAGQSISSKLASGLESGNLEKAISGALATARQLWSVLANVGGVLGNIFGPAAEVGSGALTALEKITGTLRELSGTEQAQKALTAVFTILNEVGAALGSVLASGLSTALPLLGVLATTLDGPITSALRAIVPAVSALVAAIGSALAPVVARLAETVGGTMLPVVTRLALMVGGALADAFEDLSPVLETVADVLADTLEPVFKALPAAIKPIVDNFKELSPIWARMAQQLANDLGPSLRELGGVVGELLPIIGQLSVAGTSLVANVLSAIQPAIGPAITAISWLANVILNSLVYSLRNFLVPILRAVAALLRGDFRAAWDAVKLYLSNVRDHFSKIWQNIKSVTAAAALAVGRAISGMATAAWREVSNMGRRVWQAAKSGMADLVLAIGRGVDSGAKEVGKLPGAAVRALGNLGSLLYESGKALIGGFVSGIKAAAGAVKDAVSSVLKGARNLFPNSPAKEGPFSGRGWVLYSGKAISEALAEGMRDRYSMVKRASHDLITAAQLEFGAPAMVASYRAEPGPVGLQPGDQIVLSPDGQTQFAAYIDRQARGTINRTIVAPASRGRSR